MKNTNKKRVYKSIGLWYLNGTSLLGCCELIFCRMHSIFAYKNVTLQNILILFFFLAMFGVTSSMEIYLMATTQFSNKEVFSKTIESSGDSLGKDHEKIVEIVSNVNGEIDEQKSLRRNNAGSKIEKLDQDVQNAVREFADLKETVSKLQEQIQEFQQKNMQLQAENKKLNSQLQSRTALRMLRGAFSPNYVAEVLQMDLEKVQALAEQEEEPIKMSGLTVRVRR